MKKMMVMACAVAFAAAAQAAAITWGSGTINDPSGAAAKATVTAYLLSTTQTDYNKYTSYTTGAALSDAIYKDYGASLSGGQTSSTKSLANLKDTGNSYAKGDTAYAVILYTWGSGDDLHYMGNVADYTFVGTSDFTWGNMSKYIGGGTDTTATATAWQAVPEPTSGLLLLLGMAGLALRRRRA